MAEDGAPDARPRSRLAPVEPRRLILAIRATTRRSADFDAQMRAVPGPAETDPFPEAARTLETLLVDGLRPR